MGVSVFSVGMASCLHFMFYLILYISALVANKRGHWYHDCKSLHYFSLLSRVWYKGHRILLIAHLVLVKISSH